MRKRKASKSRRKIIYFVIVAVVVFGFSGLFLRHINYARMLSYIIPHKFVLGVRTSVASGQKMYGVGVDMSQLLPTSEAYVVNGRGEDLIDLAGRLGINTFRITNATNAFENRPRTYTKDEWNSVLNKMQSKGIKALILIEGPNVWQKYINSSYLPFVQDYIISSGVLAHPDVYGVDLYNEPVINSDNNLSLLRSASRMIKSAYPQTRLTLGWWALDTFQKDADGQEIYRWDDYAAGKKISNFIDFYSIHMYGFDRSVFGLYPDAYLYTMSFISDVKNALQTRKPLVIEEFGAANGEAVSDQETLGSPQLQGNVYAGIYQAIIDMNDPKMLGTVAYQYNSRSPGPDAWAVIKNHGDYLFPAAYVLQKYSTGTSDIALALPFTPIPNDYLLSNRDNNRTINIKAGDIVGLSLMFDSSYNYSVSIADASLLTQSENLTYDSTRQKYYAVYHAAASGSTSLAVNQSQKCQDTTACQISPKEVFSVNLIAGN